MRVTHLEIENFRSIRHLAVELDDTTVFIGPNNAGKTAILDAMRIALTRRWGRLGTGFTEYDVHVRRGSDNPRTSPAVEIVLSTEESTPQEWSSNVAQALAEIVQLDPVTGRRTIALRTTYAWSDESHRFEPTWEFLNSEGEPLGGWGARRVNLARFWSHLPVFYLGAQRDVADEFSPHSRFWGRLLKSLEIPEELESVVQEILDELDEDLLDADPRLRDISSTLGNTTTVAVRRSSGAVDLRIAPFRTSDLLARTEVILRNGADGPWLPLRRQGQGLQSLSIIFLFQAFVEHLLRTIYEQESQPVLVLEEPETHLHPQAARTLWERIRALPGQKIVATHSPYFVQHVPLRNLRLVRLTSNGTAVRSLPSRFSATIPRSDHVDTVAQSSEGLIEYEASSTRLTVKGCLDEANYRSLLEGYGGTPLQAEATKALADLQARSSLYVTADELESLETFAQRMRGEVLFAERWLIVEGQSDYVIVRALAIAMRYDLDQHGVSVIDTQNNGNPTAFAALARALGIPWVAVFDGDDQGHRYIQAIQRRGFSEEDVRRQCRVHSHGDLEEQLIADGWRQDLSDIRSCQRGTAADSETDEELTTWLRHNKTTYATALARRIIATPNLVRRAPESFRWAVTELRGDQ